MFKVFPVKKSDGLWYGIENDGGILYEDNFDTQEEAQKFADAHNQGAQSYEEAYAMIYGLGEEGVQRTAERSAEAVKRGEMEAIIKREYKA